MEGLMVRMTSYSAGATGQLEPRSGQEAHEVVRQRNWLNLGGQLSFAVSVGVVQAVGGWRLNWH